MSDFLTNVTPQHLAVGFALIGFVYAWALEIADRSRAEYEATHTTTETNNVG